MLVCRRFRAKGSLQPESRRLAANLATHTFPPLLEDHQCSRRNLASLLQSCISDETHVTNVPEVHAQVVVSGFYADTFMGNMLLSGYSKCGRIEDAQKLFDGMPNRSLVSWSTLISMYSQQGHPGEALDLFCCFRRFFRQGPNEFILASVLRACVQLGSIDHAVQVHGVVMKSGFDSDVYVGTTLMICYSKTGYIEAAFAVFDELPVKNSVTWTAIISGYSQTGRSRVSLELFKKMMGTGVRPDRFVLSSVISACASLCFLEGGEQVHGYVYRNGTEFDISVNNVLIDLYAKCSRVRTARKLFDQMDTINLVSWTTMVSGYMQNSCDSDALNLFSEMNQLGWRSDAFACTSVMTSCGSLMALQQGEQVHGYIIKANLEDDEFVKNGIIDMYAKCNSLVSARSAFDAIPKKNVISYNAMIEGYVSHEDVAESIKLFKRMRSESLSPTLLTFISLLGASASQCEFDLSRQIHGLIIKYGVSLDLFSGSALIDVYSKCLCTDDARAVFEEMEEWDLVVWNAMISGYTQNGREEEALKLFHKLCLAGMRPSEFTFVSLLTASSNLASALHGLQFHGQIIRAGLESDLHVSNALIDMYAKCGSVTEARALFDKTHGRDVVCWNSMISKYAQHGHAEDALEIFQKMRDGGIEPNYVTFIGVLSACSHAGLVEGGLFHFNSMRHGFQIEPGMEHYACVVGLLGRAGRLHEAKEFIEQMPIEPAAVVWRSLLGACQLFGDTDLGKYASEKATSNNPNDSGSYILLSNILASRDMWVDVEKVRKRMDLSGVTKEPGYSWIEVKNSIHMFASRDEAHAEVNAIYSLLDSLILLSKDAGYTPDTNVIFMHD
uniref:Pentatricopeptide repeat-containing protein At4g39530 n=1 Tax=Anthurium amnicola TaxID=1678845 RepID=A0A1D1YMB5_9ARAE